MKSERNLFHETIHSWRKSITVIWFHALSPNTTLLSFKSAAAPVDLSISSFHYNKIQLSGALMVRRIPPRSSTCRTRIFIVLLNSIVRFISEHFQQMAFESRTAECGIAMYRRCKFKTLVSSYIRGTSYTNSRRCKS